ncbi:MAG: serine hydrolase domain-containing protein [Promethearchaeota archaeon]
MTIPEEMRMMLETQISDAMVQMKVPGLAIALIKEGKIVYERGFGTKDYFKNYPTKQSVKPETIFEIGSISKSFTALAIMQLQAAGKLDVNDSINKYLPWFKLGNPDHPILIHHLLSHSSGIPDLGSAVLSISSVIDMGVEIPMIPFSTLDDFKLHINGAQSEIIFNPGEHFYYFNDGYDILGMIITAVSGMQYEDYIHKNIFIPLEMITTCFPTNEFSDVDKTKHYMNKDGKIIEVPRTVDQINNPAGGIISSVRDMANYLNMFMDGGIFRGKEFVSKEIITKLTSPHQLIDCSKSPVPYAEKLPWYGYGWMIHEGFFGHTLVEHAGGTGGAYAHAFMIPDLKIALVALSNIGAGPQPIYFQALAMLMGKTPIELQPPNPIPNFQKIVGKYASYKNIMKVDISTKGEGVLYLENALMGKLAMTRDLSDETGMTWLLTMPTGTIAIYFKEDSKGKIILIVERTLYHKID